MKKRVLLAEDDADDRLIFSELFSEVCNGTLLLDSVEDGLEAIQYLKNIDKDTLLPSLIVLDLNMPKMNGKETLSYLKSSKRYKSIPVIIYSTLNEVALIEEFEKLGASLVMAKPDSYDGFKQMIRIFLEKTLFKPALN